MEFQCLKTNNVNFTSHNIEIKNAQQVLQKARQVFPMASPTKIDTFYRANDSKKVASRLQQTINQNRDIASDSSRYAGYIPKKAELELIKKSKVGNCNENAIIGLASALANGHKDVKKVTLSLRHIFVDKNNNIAFEKTQNYDHTFILLNSAKGKNKTVVIDPWLDLCDYWGNIVAKFKTMFASDKYIDSFIAKNREEFTKQLNGEPISNYRERLSYCTMPTFEDEWGYDKLADYTRKQFPNLLI